MKTKRIEWEDSDMTFTVGDIEYKIIVLAKGESTPVKTSTHYDHCFYGPALVVIETLKFGGQRIDEYDLHDRGIWSWLNQLVIKEAKTGRAE